eukprot:CAMPEP_0206175124 /NCGR_PEP_ID=MMETSP1474-20131121/54065_1 /ASSEMBLY_ACC=CAM_ASM_001110 /TAXON_ID=97495 /ORGANISM="Imantonia sp., Strain RCC918" /LENGTH=141 /DNA_ID=CAMNT_0053585155 /DNA_START=366 /DNA_END=791 /DNA_ORIENTATION=+
MARAHDDFDGARDELVPPEGVEYHADAEETDVRDRAPEGQRGHVDPVQADEVQSGGDGGEESYEEPGEDECEAVVKVEGRLLQPELAQHVPEVHEGRRRFAPHAHQRECVPVTAVEVQQPGEHRANVVHEHAHGARPDAQV